MESAATMLAMLFKGTGHVEKGTVHVGKVAYLVGTARSCKCRVNETPTILKITARRRYLKVKFPWPCDYSILVQRIKLGKGIVQVVEATTQTGKHSYLK